MAWLQLVLAALAALIFVQGRPVDRAIRLLNESGSKLEVYWVNSQTGDRVLMSTPVVHSGAVMPLNSFVGHEFEIREVPSTKTGECKDQTCHSGSFVVSENDDQAVRILEGFEMVISDSKTQAKDEAEDIVDRCQAQAQKIIEDSGGSADGALQAMELLSSCVESGVAHKLELANEEIAFQASVREDMAELLENYTCVDDSLDTTEDIDTSSFTDRDEVTHVVHIKHDRPSSKIHVVENFITIEECDAMEKAASRTLHRATVADGKGGSEYSPNRKAMQAGITVDWEKEEEGDPIARLSRRVYDYTNFVLDLGIEEHGQEDLMSIQYFGRGKNNTEEPPDRYTPHCDGDCTGLPHKTGTRMATMVMYCSLPTSGGATNFRNAGVHVKPVAGNAIFFSYINPETRMMDTGFTEHSGCPVFEGEKKIVTQWIRLGVDAENPWDSFNTLGIKKSEAALQ